MKKLFTTGEVMVLLAGICWLVALPLLAAGYSLLWFVAQGLYFVGVSFIVWRYFARYVRH